MREPVVVFATNGSPQDPYFWQQYGSREAYAGLRREEAFASMHAAGVKDVIFLPDMPGGEKLVDQELFRNLRPAYDLLSELVQPPHGAGAAHAGVRGRTSRSRFVQLPGRATRQALQHPLLGGAAVSPLARGRRSLSGLHRRYQRSSRRKAYAAEQAAKREMCLAYPSQGDFLTHFDVSSEHRASAARLRLYPAAA